MDRKTYNRTTEKELKGRKVRSLTNLRNGMFSLPAGTIWTIEGKAGGFQLTSDPCPHCGVRVYITKVQPQDVDFTDQANIWQKEELDGSKTH